MLAFASMPVKLRHYLGTVGNISKAAKNYDNLTAIVVLVSIRSRAMDLNMYLKMFRGTETYFDERVIAN